jgi:hypothetical protein
MSIRMEPRGHIPCFVYITSSHHKTRMKQQHASIVCQATFGHEHEAHAVNDHWYRHDDISRPVSFTVSAWDWVYAANLSRLQREKRERQRERKTSKRHVGEAHSVLILLPQRLSCYRGKIVSLRMLTNLRLADLRLILRNRDPPAKICRVAYAALIPRSVCSSECSWYQALLNDFIDY